MSQDPRPVPRPSTDPLKPHGEKSTENHQLNHNKIPKMRLPTPLQVQQNKNSHHVNRGYLHKDPSRFLLDDTLKSEISSMESLKHTRIACLIPSATDICIALDLGRALDGICRRSRYLLM